MAALLERGVSRASIHGAIGSLSAVLGNAFGEHRIQSTPRSALEPIPLTGD
jgi:hypothetical protein